MLPEGFLNAPGAGGSDGLVDASACFR
jgi:hypothetical protein